jgi:serine/threonine-protein kinase HipA
VSPRTRQSFDVVLDDASLGPATAIGVLHCDQRNASPVVSFEYNTAYLAARDAVAIDPQLPLLPGPNYPARGQNLFGTFRDMAPDRWGRMLMERREAMDATEAGRNVRRLSEWDFLIGVNDFTRMGALRLRETTPPHAFVDDRERSAPPVTGLRKLEAIARRLSRDDAEQQPGYVRWLAQLVVPGTSLGGARPKATFAEANGDLWLAKFPAHDDRRDVGAWEYLAWQLARAAGVEMTDAKLMRFGRSYRTFTTRRFDRVAGSRRLYASAMTLLVRNDGDPGSYLDLAQVIQTHGDPATIAEDLAQMYRRAVFSILVGNRDDHLRNHGFLRTPHGWKLAPAFDLNPNPDKREHALAIDAADSGPAVRRLHATHRYYRLGASEAAAIEQEVRDAVARWRSVADDLKLGRLAQGQLDAIIDATRD